MNLPIAPASGRATVARERWRRTRPLLRYRADAGLWKAAAAGLGAASSAAAVLGVLGAPTGFGAPFDVASAFGLNAAAMTVVVRGASGLFRRVDLPLRPATTGIALYSVTMVSVVLGFELDPWLAILLAIVYLLIGAGLGVLAGLWSGRAYGWRPKAAAAACVLAVAGAIWGFFGGAPREAVPANAGAEAAEAALPPEPLAAGDPSAPGAYAYREFAYGSGRDRHRTEFGSGAELITRTADASAYIDDWPWLRRLFWGFDQTELPVNGRVWMPEGDGPFPLVLMVHGNHLMEDFSDAGYAYLGRLLASRGFVAVSADENFLNYSAWSGIPKQDMKVRAWMLLRHVGELERLAADPATAFYGKLDLDRVMLLGHSRGGQAAAMAADRDEWFAADESLPDPNAYKVVSVAALAPTDTAVDGQRSTLRDVSYLTLQGAADADVSTFDGERTYLRAELSPGSSGFKTALYIGGANHGQFNTTWGARDEELPTGLFLRRPELSGAEQRRIASAYVSAFAEATLRGETGYLPLFRDYRAGVAAGFLPATRYYSRYEDGGFRPIARFEGAAEGSAAPEGSSGTKAEASGLSWTVAEALDRVRNGKGGSGVALTWGEEGGSFALDVSGFDFDYDSDSDDDLDSDSAADAGSGTSGRVAKSEKTLVGLTFAMADLGGDDPGKDGAGAAIRAEVELTDANGRSARVPLARILPTLPPERTAFTWLGPLQAGWDGGKYGHAFQPSFQTYDIPAERFEEANPALDWDRIERIVFRMGGDGREGQAMLDDVGWTE